MSLISSSTFGMAEGLSKVTAPAGEKQSDAVRIAAYESIEGTIAPRQMRYEGWATFERVYWLEQN